MPSKQQKNHNKPNFKQLSNDSYSLKHQGICRKNNDFAKTLIHTEENDYEIHYTGPTDQEKVDKYGYVIKNDMFPSWKEAIYYGQTLFRDHVCCLDDKLYKIGSDCPCSKFFKNSKSCKLCDQSTGNVCPFHFNIQKLSIDELLVLKYSKKLNNETLLDIFGIKIMKKISFDIYVAVMQRKYIYFNYTLNQDENEYDDYDEYDYDEYEHDDYAYEEHYVNFFGDASDRYDLRRKRERLKQAEKAIAKKRQEKERKQLQIDNTKKDITSIISLEILRNKLNNDCLAHIASFFSGKFWVMNFS
jgi:hypothetical protein